MQSGEVRFSLHLFCPDEALHLLDNVDFIYFSAFLCLNIIVSEGRPQEIGSTLVASLYVDGPLGDFMVLEGMYVERHQGRLPDLNGWFLEYVSEFGE